MRQPSSIAVALYDAFRRFAHAVALAVGAPWAFGCAVLFVLVWGISGPMFDYSVTWQLTVNTGTTIVTFLMVFIIQNTQNRDSQVMHLKLDELIRAVTDARNELVDMEDLSDEELRLLQLQFAEMRKAATARAHLRDSDAQARTTSSSCTADTPAAPHAARSASCRSVQERT